MNSRKAEKYAIHLVDFLPSTMNISPATAAIRHKFENVTKWH